MTESADKKEASPRIICISSGKGGVGKTSITVNTAAALAASGRKVLLVDGDLGLANVDIVLGLNVERTLRETVELGADPAELLVEVAENFFVLPASSGVPEMASLSYEDQVFLTNALEQIVGGFELVLVDASAGIGESVLWFNQWAHVSLVVLTPDPTSMTDAYALIKVLRTQYGKNNFHLVVNSVKSKKEGGEIFKSMAAVLKNFLGFEPGYLGAIPSDSAVVKAIRSQKPFFLAAPDSRAGRAVKELAARVGEL